MKAGAPIVIPVTLHVFNFAIPDQLHVKSQMNFSHQTLLSAYGVSCCGPEYRQYVDKIKQYFIDDRIRPLREKSTDRHRTYP